MGKRMVKRLLAVSAVSFSCLWLSVVSTDKGWARTSRDAEISSYIQQLKDKDTNVSYNAAYALEKIGGEAVPALTLFCHFPEEASSK
ncbi:hypothetical protein NIES4073_03270 (plasmid) [Kalymmatonema gypsitolerans NIES-4073]|nr:hypothetical protein NIES4073_03270 [Scytonema sp. NIES-4073]